MAALISLIGGYHYANNASEELVSTGIGIFGTIAAGVVGFIGSLIARQNPIEQAVQTAPPGWYGHPRKSPNPTGRATLGTAIRPVDAPGHGRLVTT